MARTIGDGIMAVRWPPSTDLQQRTIVQELGGQLQQTEDPRVVLEAVRKCRRNLATMAEEQYNHAADDTETLDVEVWLTRMKQLQDETIVTDFQSQQVVLRDQVFTFAAAMTLKEPV